MRTIRVKSSRLLFLSLLLCTNIHAQNWTKLAQFGAAPQFVSDIYFIDDNIGFAGVYGNTSTFLYRTTNGGLNWQGCATPKLNAPAFFSDIFFRTPTEGWLTFMYGNNSSNLWHTTDAGQSWNAVASFPDVWAAGVRQTSKALIVTGVQPGTVANPAIYVSTDNAATFHTMLPNSEHCGLDFVDDLHGVAAGYNDQFASTFDGGQTWSPIGTLPPNEAFGVYGIPGSSTFIIAPEDILKKATRNVIRSTDYGQSWTTLAVPPKQTSGDIKGVSTPNGVLLFTQSYAGSVPKGVLRSKDLGNTWTNIGGVNSNNDARFFVQQCGNRIFIGDTDGALYVTYNGGDGTHFSCSIADTIFLTASLCDSIEQLHFLNSPHSGDSVYVTEASILDSSQATIRSRAFGFDSIPHLSYLLTARDSMGFLVHWKPRRMTDTAISVNTSIQFVTLDKRTGVVDTIIIPVLLTSLDVRPQWTATSLITTSALACQEIDTRIVIQNTGCDTLWITNKLAFAQHVNWTLATPLPIAIPPGQSASVVARLIAVTPDLNDTLSLFLHYLRHDTSLTVYFKGHASARDPFSSPGFVHLDSVLMCGTTDTLLSLLDTLCGSMTISSLRSDSAQWAFFTADRKPITFPTTLQNTLGFPLRVEFTPSYLQTTTDTLQITYQYFDSNFTRKIILQGSAKRSSGFDYPRVLDLGSRSTCAPFDTLITLQNQTCAKALINSASVFSAFQVLDALPITVDTNGTVTLHLRFSPKAAQNYKATVTFGFTEYGLPTSDTLQLTGTGVITPATFTITPPRKSLDVTLTECDAPDTIAFDISNPSCDSLFIQMMSIIGTAKDVLSATIDNAIPFMLGGAKIAHVVVTTSNMKAGTYSGSLLFHLSSTDTLIPITVTIARMPRTVALDTTPIDLGSLKPCETHDIAIPYTNTGCTLDSVTGWTLSNWSQGFNVFGTGRYPPYALKAGETDTLHITFDGHHTGTIYDTVRVGFSTDDNQTRSIPVKTFVPNIDSVLFTIDMPARLASNQEFTANVLPDRTVTGKGIYTIAGKVRYPANDFKYISIKEGANLNLTSSGPTNDPKLATISFVLSNASGITLDPTVPVLSLSFRTFVTDTISYSLALDSMVLNGSDPDFANCTLAAGGTSRVASFDPSCGDSLLITSLNGYTLFLASDPMPNPASTTTTLRLEATTAGVADIELRDALGRALLRSSNMISESSTHDCSFDVTSLSAGTYTAEINFTSNHNSARRLRRLLVIH
jgi:photosystem II stability/assembly factor-like uncharacterized protein